MAKVRLDDVAVEARETWNQDRKDVPVVGLENLEPDEIWLRQWNVNPDENTFTKGFKKGQLLFGRRRAYQKKMSLASCDGICSGDITVIAARPEKIVPELLPFYLRTDAFFDFAMRGSGGSLSPRVKWSHISDYEFDLPPMDEQKKLAELLWAANDLKESYKKAITATDEMLKAKFREMFGENKQPTEAVGHVCSIIPGKSIPLSKENEGGNIAYVKVADFNFPGNERAIVSSPRHVSYETASSSGIIPINSTLFAKNGAAALSNKKRITRISACIDMNTMAVFPIDDRIEADYLFAFFENLDLTQYVLIGAIPQYRPKEIMNIQIPLPPLALQREFVAIADKAESAKANLKKSIAAIDQVMKGLINQ